MGQRIDQRQSIGWALQQVRRLSGRPVNVTSALQRGRALTVREFGALSDFDNVTVRIPDVASYLAILGDRLGDEFGSSTFP